MANAHTNGLSYSLRVMDWLNNAMQNAKHAFWVLDDVSGSLMPVKVVFSSVSFHLFYLHLFYLHLFYLHLHLHLVYLHHFLPRLPPPLLPPVNGL
jgi:hypothetical protein